VIDRKGDLIGIGSLQLQQAREAGPGEHLNMVVPIDLLPPILHDLQTLGRPNRPARPWLGFYVTEIEDRAVVVGLASGGPAQKAKLQTGDIVLSVAGTPVSDLVGLFRGIWALGEAGVEVPLSVFRDGRTFEVRVASSDRNRFLKSPSLH
jgi:S1-C subfamily serine protease